MTASKRILCAVDLSPGSECVVAQAAEFAHLMTAELELLYVYGVPLLPLEEGDGESSEDELARLLDKAERKLACLGQAPRARGIKVNVRLLEGDVSETILRESARVVASIVVVGTHGRSGFKRLLLGSTAERVVRMSRLPVVTVPFTN